MHPWFESSPIPLAEQHEDFRSEDIHLVKFRREKKNYFDWYIIICLGNPDSRNSQWRRQQSFSDRKMPSAEAGRIDLGDVTPHNIKENANISMIRIRMQIDLRPVLKYYQLRCLGSIRNELKFFFL